MHYTPSDVASALAAYAPRHIRSVLEPAVGEGSLLLPLLERRSRSISEIVCIDSDSRALEGTSARLKPLKVPLKMIQADFVEWCGSGQGVRLREHFDCVVMNPPFSGRKGVLRTIGVKDLFSAVPFEARAVPIEIAFVACGLKMARPGGAVLAVVPASVVSAQSTRWFRKYLLQVADLRLVHELPKYTFPGVEAKVYLMVLYRAKRCNIITLANHSVREPEMLEVLKADMQGHYRFDHSFNKAYLWQRQIVRENPQLNWRSVELCADVFRGKLSAPFTDAPCVHSTHFVQGVWKVPPTVKPRAGEVGVRCNDILVVRVARHCHDTFSVYTKDSLPCSDCIIVMRPKPGVSATCLLLGLRLMFAWNLGKDLVVNGGTGARYITEQSLSAAVVPLGLTRYYAPTVQKYRRAVLGGRWEDMRGLEARLRTALGSGAASV
jgi:hypothetical protein